MVPHIRQSYNASFTEEKYQQMLDAIMHAYNHKPEFRIAETPVFVNKELGAKIFEATQQIVDVIVRPDFKKLTQGALLAGQVVPNETEHTTFLQLDFGICTMPDGSLSPQLIEAQGFPSLYYYQHLVANMYRKFFSIPENYSHLFCDLTDIEYLNLLKSAILANEDPKNVIVLEVEPTKQATQIDFWGTQHQLGVPVKCITDLHQEGRDVYYLDNDGKKVPVHRIYNRVIFDELVKRDDLKRSFYFTREANVSWAGHPNWFFRISKHSLPLFDTPYVPKSRILSEIESLPDDLHNYVLKPLYSFAGSGVLININKYDLDGISDPENYILQRKVPYAPIVDTMDQPAKCEIRVLMIWEEGAPRPRMVNNLARLSKGEMVGVKYNKDKTWVGGSVGFFEKGAYQFG